MLVFLFSILSLSITKRKRKNHHIDYPRPLLNNDPWGRYVQPTPYGHPMYPNPVYEENYFEIRRSNPIYTANPFGPHPSIPRSSYSSETGGVADRNSNYEWKDFKKKW